MCGWRAASRRPSPRARKISLVCRGGAGDVIDLGAGFGMHSIPLARAGRRVFAVDISPLMLAQLRSLSDGLDVTTSVGDLTRFAEHLPRGWTTDLILCMGDTLTHLADEAAVVRLARAVGTALSRGGRFIATFRDYTRLPEGAARFIPVRSDSNRILTCFLEAADTKVLVHDIVHERLDERWVMRVGSYEKLRLSPEWVRSRFEESGMRASLREGPRGMTMLLADAGRATDGPDK